MSDKPKGFPTWDASTHLGQAVIELNEVNKTHGVDMRGGKKYTMVKDRVEIFRKYFGTGYGIETSIEYCDDTFVRMKAVIRDLEKDGMIVGSGHAEELRGSTNVNKTSALENAETGAIGRALASIGLAGGEYASANEMEAVGRKEKALKNPPAVAPFKCEVTSPEGKKTTVEAEEDARIEDLVFEGFKEFIRDCKTDEQLDEFISGQNTRAVDILKSSDRWDEFCEMGKRQRIRIGEALEGESK
jgi:hypothetical protein